MYHVIGASLVPHITPSIPYVLTAAHRRCLWLSAFHLSLAVGAGLGPHLGKNKSPRGLTLLGQPSSNDSWEAVDKYLSAPPSHMESSER